MSWPGSGADDVSALFGSSEMSNNWFDSLGEELAISEDDAHLFPDLSNSQPSEPLPLPPSESHSYYASSSPAFAAPSPPVQPFKPKFESALSKKQVDAYDPPLPTTTQRQQRKASANAAAPSGPFQVAAAPPYARPPSAAALRTFSPPPLVNSSPLNPARPPSRGPTTHRPPSRTASRNAVLPPPPAPLSVRQPPLAAPQRIATPPSVVPPPRQVVPPPLTFKTQEALKSPILSVQPPSPAPPKKHPDPLPSLAPPFSQPELAEASPLADAWGFEETLPLDEEGWGFDEELNLDDLTLEPPKAKIDAGPTQVQAEKEIQIKEEEVASEPFLSRDEEAPAPWDIEDIKQEEVEESIPPATMPLLEEQQPVVEKEHPILEEQQPFSAEHPPSPEEAMPVQQELVSIKRESPDQEEPPLSEQEQPVLEASHTEEPHSEEPVVEESRPEQLIVEDPFADLRQEEPFAEEVFAGSRQADQYTPVQEIAQAQAFEVDQMATPMAQQTEFRPPQCASHLLLETALRKRAAYESPFTPSTDAAYAPLSTTYSPMQTFSPAPRTNTFTTDGYAHDLESRSSAFQEQPESPQSSIESPRKGRHYTSSSGSTAGTAGITDTYPFSDQESPPLETPWPVGMEQTGYFDPPPLVAQPPLPPVQNFPPLPVSRKPSYSTASGQTNGAYSSYDPPMAVSRPPSRGAQYAPPRSYSPASMPPVPSIPTQYSPAPVQRQFSPAPPPLAQPFQNPYAPAALSKPLSNQYTPSQPVSNSLPPFSTNQLPALPLGKSPFSSTQPINRQPSPSLPGTPKVYQANGVDPSMRPPCPIAVFGLGGKLLTYFPPPSSSSTFFGYTGSASKSAIAVRSLSSALEKDPSRKSLESYPGPLLGSTAGKAKNKKDALAWLACRVSELEKGEVLVGADALSQTLQPGYVENLQRDKEKVLLLKLLKALVENDGKLSGSAKLEETVKEILAPDVPQASGSEGHFVTAAHLQQPFSRSSSPPIASSELRNSDLDTIQGHLLKGDRKAALRHTLDRQLWPHALLIATSLHKETWKEVVAEFIKTDLGSGKDKAALQIAYGLFAGLGASAVENVFPVKTSASPVSTNGQPSAGLPVPLAMGPISRAPSPAVPSFPDVPALARTVSSEHLQNWQDMLSVIVFNKSTNIVDTAALVSLGDALLINGKVEAADICYLLAMPPGSTGLSLGARLGILGHDFRISSSISSIDSDALFMTELFEFGLSLAPAVKGQEPFIGLPHFQAWRLILAHRFAEIGQVSKAQRYGEAITATLKLASKSSPFYNWTLCHQLPSLMDQLSGAPIKSAESGSWVSRTMQRPKLDTLWTTLEGRFTSFVAGEGVNEPLPPKEKKAPAPSVAAGPFASYSSIAPAGSGQISREGSLTDLKTLQPAANGTSAYHSTSNAPSAYEPSAQSLPPLPLSTPTASRMPPLPKPAPFVDAAAPRKPPGKHTHTRSQSLGFLAYGSDPYASAPAWAPKVTAPPPDVLERDEGAEEPSPEEPRQDSNPSWWGTQKPSSASARQPTFFSTSEATIPEDSTGFISPMSSATTFAPTSPAYSRPTTATTTLDEYGDEDDLGFSNNANKRARQQSEQPEGTKSEEAHPGRSASVPPGGQSQTQQLQAPGLRSTPSFWGIGRLFKRDGAASPGPVKANLGEESAFVYDPELKRWVNKKGGAQTEAPSPAMPPPPVRAQTASPSMSSAAIAPSISAMPPRNSVSNLGPAALPPPPSRVMSPPTSNYSTGPPTPSLSARGSPDSSAMPPPTRRAASGAKSKARSKYIVID